MAIDIIAAVITTSILATVYIVCASCEPRRPRSRSQARSYANAPDAETRHRL